MCEAGRTVPNPHWTTKDSLLWDSSQRDDQTVCMIMTMCVWTDLRKTACSQVQAWICYLTDVSERISMLCVRGWCSSYVWAWKHGHMCTFSPTLLNEWRVSFLFHTSNQPVESQWEILSRKPPEYKNEIRFRSSSSQIALWFQDQRPEALCHCFYFFLSFLQTFIC